MIMIGKSIRQIWVNNVYLVSPGALWVCVVLNPNSHNVEKEQWQQLLEHWSSNNLCPLEDADSRNIINSHLTTDNLGRSLVVPRARDGVGVRGR